MSTLAELDDERQAEDLGCDLEQINKLIKLTEELIWLAEWNTPVQPDSRGPIEDFVGYLRDDLGDTLRPFVTELEEKIAKLSNDDGR